MIYYTKVFTGSSVSHFENDLNEAIDRAQAEHLDVEVQYSPSTGASGYVTHNALLIVRKRS